MKALLLNGEDIIARCRDGDAVQLRVNLNKLQDRMYETREQGKICHAEKGAELAEPLIRPLPLSDERKQNILKIPSYPPFSIFPSMANCSGITLKPSPSTKRFMKLKVQQMIMAS